MSIVEPEEERDNEQTGDADRARRGAVARAHREASIAHWEAAAPGWVARQAVLREFSEPVTHWMIDAAEPQPGHRVLELAAGLGDTGFLVAEMVGPVGGVITSDQADAMLDGARKRAGELNLTNVEFQVLNAEWIDLPVASVDIVLCRWGYMLMADPAAALAETRRVMRPGGHLSLAVWDEIEHNPWAGAPAAELQERGLAEPPPRNVPGLFALDDIVHVRDLLEAAGFHEVWVEAVDLIHRAEDFEEYWQTTLDLMRDFRETVLARPEAEIAEIRDGLARRLKRFVEPDGSVEVPMRALCAMATA